MNMNRAPFWKIDLAVGLRRTGFSIRRIAGIAGLSKTTVATVTKDIFAKCGCGAQAGHKGWCSFLYRQSARRQASLRGRVTVGKEIPGLYHTRACSVCGRLIENALRHRECVAASRQAHSGALPLDAENAIGRTRYNYIPNDTPAPEAEFEEKEAIEGVILRLISQGMSRSQAESKVREFVDF